VKYGVLFLCEDCQTLYVSPLWLYVKGGIGPCKCGGYGYCKGYGEKTETLSTRRSKDAGIN